MIRRTKEGLEDAVCLVVQGDDLGMCHAVNDGILAAYDEGILTQTTAMAPCPWWPEGVKMAMEAGLPVGMHSTLTCEWDRLRWRPLTGGESLVTDDMGFYATVEAARRAADPEEAAVELMAQRSLFDELRCNVSHVDVQMGEVCATAYQKVCQASRTPFLYEGVDPHLSFSSRTMMSDKADDGGGKLAWLTNYLEHLTPGYHLLITHPAVDHPELASMAGANNPARDWAARHRLSDLRTLCDPEVSKVLEDLDIQLLSASDVPVVG